MKNEQKFHLHIEGFPLVIKNNSSVSVHNVENKVLLRSQQASSKILWGCGNIKYYSIIPSENVSGKRINYIKRQFILYVLNNKFFSIFP
jgi:hypothetical protein